MTDHYFTSTIIPISSSAHLESALAFFQGQPRLAHLVGHSPNLTIYNLPLETVTIDMCRAIIQELSYARYTNQARGVVVLAADQATLPAQNSLLKILEEPPAQTQLVLTVNQLNRLLPTIRSRCQVWLGEETGQSEIEPELKALANQLESLSLSSAINLAEKYQDRLQAVALVEALIRYAHQRSQANPQHRLVNQLQQLNQAHRDLKANCSVRLALEELFFGLLTPKR